MSDELRKALNEYRTKMGEVSDERVAPHVMPDIKPYRSMITGEVIASRSKHREHLKDHGYEEVGNDSSLSKPCQGIPDVSPQKRKELIRSQIASLTDKEFRAMHQRAIDNWKWNSREK